MSDLIQRPRRLRKSEALRALVRETHLRPDDFILPLFACPGQNVRREISSMPGVHNLSVDEIAREATAAYEIGRARSHSLRVAGVKRRNGHRRLR